MSEKFKKIIDLFNQQSEINFSGAVMYPGGMTCGDRSATIWPTPPHNPGLWQYSGKFRKRCEISSITDLSISFSNFFPFRFDLVLSLDFPFAVGLVSSKTGFALFLEFLIILFSENNFHIFRFRIMFCLFGFRLSVCHSFGFDARLFRFFSEYLFPFFLPPFFLSLQEYDDCFRL